MVLPVGFLSRSLGLTEAVESGPDQPVGDYSGDVQPPALSQTRRPAGVADAVTLPAVFRSIQLIQGMGANLVRTGLDSWRDDVLVTPRPAIVRAPDPWRTLRSFAARFLTNAATDGNNFLLKSRIDGMVSGAQVLDPNNVRIAWENGRKRYHVTAQRRDGRWSTTSYGADEVDHVWCGLELPGLDRALGPIAACRAALEGHLDTRAYAAGWFQATDVPSGVLSSDQKLDPASARAYKDQWLNPTDKDTRVGPTLRVLGQGLTYAPIQLKPSDAQWLESQNFGVVDVARMFGAPLAYLHASLEGSSLTYTTLETVDRQFLTTTLLPVYLAPLEDALSALLPRGQEARLNTDELLRPDAKTQAEIDKVYLDAGVISAPEVRKRKRLTGPPPSAPAAGRAVAPAPSEDVPA